MSISKLKKYINYIIKSFYSCEVETSIASLTQLDKYFEKYHALSKFFRIHLDKLLMHQEDRKIMKTNNIAENVNRRITIRMKTMESFKNIINSEN